MKCPVYCKDDQDYCYIPSYDAKGNWIKTTVRRPKLGRWMLETSWNWLQLMRYSMIKYASWCIWYVFDASNPSIEIRENRPRLGTNVWTCMDALRTGLWPVCDFARFCTCAGGMCCEGPSMRLQQGAKCILLHLDWSAACFFMTLDCGKGNDQCEGLKFAVVSFYRSANPTELKHVTILVVKGGMIP